MPISFKLGQLIGRGPGRDPRRVLERLAGVKLSKAYARDVWPQVLEHKRYLSERLGRDVGLRVAAVDYFENLYPGAAEPARASSDALPPRLPMMTPFGQRP